jgi:UPF0755 protein
MKRRFFLILGLLLPVIVLAGFLFVNAAWMSNPGATQPKSISVSSGDTLRTVAGQLELRGVIGYALGYRLYGWLDSSAKHPKAGEYQIRPGSSYRAIARVLAAGPQREEVSITVIEGKTVDDEVALLRSMDVKPDIFWGMVGKSKNALPFDRSLADTYPFLASLPKGASLEGFLFPDTYRVWKDELPESLVKKQLKEFQDGIVDMYEKHRIASKMSWNEAVTLASVIEAEVKGDADRRIVAGIFLRRMRDGMRLQSDATTRYVLDSGRTRVTAKDLEQNSPYNTYLNDGLPPGPINNPGLSSIRAVFEPTETPYYYFVTDPKGDVLYARTYEEHKRNIERAY